ncbi:MAG: hypothetical protein K0R70_1316, partial [Steroidobacteraceae bacterium]|nr:hypothetical protein [Steroidobacteraceae bacterium]
PATKHAGARRARKVAKPIRRSTRELMADANA